jgi:hypothetical protein
MPDPFVGWFAKEILLQEVFSRALGLLGRRSWRWRLARRVRRQTRTWIARWRLRRWLGRQATWDALVHPLGESRALCVLGTGRPVRAGRPQARRASLMPARERRCEPGLPYADMQTINVDVWLPDAVAERVAARPSTYAATRPGTWGSGRWPSQECGAHPPRTSTAIEGDPGDVAGRPYRRIVGPCCPAFVEANKEPKVWKSPAP